MAAEDVEREPEPERSITFAQAIFVACLTAVLAVAGSNLFPVRHQASPEELHDQAALLMAKEATAQHQVDVANQAATQARILSMQETIIKACVAQGNTPVYMNQNLDCRHK